MADVVLILGSGPNVVECESWARDGIDRIVAINNAWRVRDDWDELICPEDFPLNRRPRVVMGDRRLVEANAFVPAQNAYGGFVYAGGTMAFTAGYWALYAHKPKVIAFLGCDMVYADTGPTHYYGTGTADPLRADITLQDLSAKSARLGAFAAAQGCACVNLSRDDSRLVFPRSRPHLLPQLRQEVIALPRSAVVEERRLGYMVPSGRYWESENRFDPAALARIDALWAEGYAQMLPRMDCTRAA